MTQKTTVTLYGNVGKDPELRTLPAREVTKEVYDSIIDDVVERAYTTRERELRTFSIAVSGRDDQGQPITRWIRCTDWHNLSRLVFPGYRVQVLEAHASEFGLDLEAVAVYRRLLDDFLNRQIN
jgi:hypothetical protein